jgi:hypothetical protein
MKKARGLCEVGVHDLCKQFVGKSMVGDESDVYTCPMFVESDRQPAEAVDEPEWGGSIRLGTMRVMNQVVRQNPALTRTYTDVGAAQAFASPDPFLKSDEGVKGRVGGEDRGYSPVDPNHGAGGGAYLKEFPDADKRSTLPNWRADEDSGIAPAAGAQFPDAGRIGGVQKSKGLWSKLVHGDR